MPLNDGKPYEEFVRQVFQVIKNLEGLTTVKVEPSRVFQGNTVDEDACPIPHQIDVHWKFILDEIEYTTVIQAKDWGYQVPQKEMIAFDGIVRDISNGKTGGIFVARSGFQKGAISWAKAKGIKASELRHIYPSEKKNRIETIVLTVEADLPIIQINELDLNNWISSLTEEERQKLASQPIGIDANNLPVETESGHKKGMLVHNIDWDWGKQQSTFSHEQRFEPPLFFVLRADLPKARLHGLKATISIQKYNAEHRIHRPLTHILRSVTGDESYFVSFESSGRLMVKRAEGLPPLERPRPPASW